ncbi:MAG: hypothetical protein K1X67_00565 [Fimbriimonadaceae bacterium]|nr:hypothetical protein [Fimbriimonadaceae bacterium]
MSRVLQVLVCIALLVGVLPRGEARDVSIRSCGMPCCTDQQHREMPCCCRKPSPATSKGKNCECEIGSLPALPASAPTVALPMPITAVLPVALLEYVSVPIISTQHIPHLAMPRIRAPEPEYVSLRAPPLR